MFCKKCGNQIDDDSNVCSYCGTKTKNSYNKIDETQMGQFRNELGYINLKTKYWHHLLLAIIGYLFIDIFTPIIAGLVISIYQSKGFDFTCLIENEDWSVCPVDVVNIYVKAVSWCQVIAEIIVIAVIAVVFIKYLKLFFNQAFDKNTWNWCGTGLAIMYGGNIVYTVILELFQITSDTNANQAAVNDMIYSSPVLGLLFVVIAAPIFEELIFRFGVFRSFTESGDKKKEIIGLVVTILLFAGVHMIATVQEVFADPQKPNIAVLKNDLISLPVYLIGAFGLTFVYYKSKNLMASIGAHMIYNGISFIMILLQNQLNVIDPSASGSAISEIIINILTRL